MSPHVERLEQPPVAGDRLTIKAAGELLGVPGPTLRSWERRYGLPATTRSLGGHRRYGAVELDQLRLMRDEIAIGRHAADAARWVRGLLDESNPGVTRVHAMLEASQRLDAVDVRHVLELAEAEIGLGAAIDQVVMPAMRQIGAWWERGDCDIGQEHLTTEVVRRWLAGIITLSRPTDTGQRPVLLATGPADSHTLGLEAAAALLARLGTTTRLMGAGTPREALLTATAAAPDALVVVVSHLSTHRRSTVATLVALADAGVTTFFAGNAFLFPGSRKGVPGTYLGERISDSTSVVAMAAHDTG